MRQLCALSLNKELPLLLLSIGGDGQAPERAALSETQRLMLRTAKLITVRNLQDVALVKSVSTLPAIACFADVVWRVKLTLGLTRAVGPRSDVLVHQCDGRTRRLIGALVTSSNALGNRIGTVFKFSTQFDPAVINQPRSLQHRDIISTLTTLSTASLLVTPRLHLAISAMTLGTPVLSINVEPKTRLMLETVPELAAVIDAPVGRMRFPLWLWRAIRKHESFTVSPETTEALAESASGHVQSALVFLSRREARCVQPSMVRHRLYSTPPRSVVERPYPVNARSGLEGSPPRVQKPQRSCVDQTRWDNP